MAAIFGGAKSGVWLLTGLLAVSAAVVSIRGMRESSRLMSEAARLEKESRALQSKTDERNRTVADLEEKLRMAGEPVREAVVPTPNDGTESAERVRAIRKLAELQGQLQALNTSIGEVEARNRQLDTQAAAAEGDRTRLTASLAELTDKLTNSNRTVQALQGQIRQKDQRLNPLEAENQKLQTEEQAARTRLAEFSKQSQDLAGIRKRRAALVETLMRHYRELSDQYRALALRFDSSGDRAGANPGELSRIQAALSQVDDDMRQLNALNQKAAALEKSLKR